jgi:hypothetical protein
MNWRQSIVGCVATNAGLTMVYCQVIGHKASGFNVFQPLSRWTAANRLPKGRSHGSTS